MSAKRPTAVRGIGDLWVSASVLVASVLVSSLFGCGGGGSAPAQVSAADAAPVISKVRGPVREGRAQVEVAEAAPAAEAAGAPGLGRSEDGAVGAAKPRLELAFVGDTIFGRFRPQGFDPIVEGDAQPFAAMADALEADLRVTNLETPLVHELPEHSPSRAAYRFGASEAMARHLVDAGFDVVSVANNHHNDMRAQGHTETLEILDRLGIRAVGAPQPQPPALRFETLEVEGWRLAMLGVTARLNMPLDDPPPHIPYVSTRQLPEAIEDALATARASHDLVIVSVHWGEEYTDAPTFHQKQVARSLIEAGVDVVFGHHPHVLQGIEAHEGGVIAYSMGNFLFENVSPVPRQTGVLRVTFERREQREQRPCLASARFVPAVMRPRPYPHPEPATGLVGRRVRARLVGLSAALGTSWEEASDESLHLALGHLTCERTPSTDRR